MNDTSFFKYSIKLPQGRDHEQTSGRRSASEVPIEHAFMNSMHETTTHPVSGVERRLTILCIYHKTSQRTRQRTADSQSTYGRQSASEVPMEHIFMKLPHTPCLSVERRRVILYINRKTSPRTRPKTADSPSTSGRQSASEVPID